MWVNNAMEVKAGGVWYRQSHDDADRQSVFHMLEMLDTYHGQVTGVFTADEHYGGRVRRRVRNCVWWSSTCSRWRR
jgi:hypothetical protein